MAELNKKAPAPMEDLLVGSFAAADAVAKLLIEKGYRPDISQLLAHKYFLRLDPADKDCGT
jgi:hypothetical protein